MSELNDLLGSDDEEEQEFLNNDNALVSSANKANEHLEGTKDLNKTDDTPAANGSNLDDLLGASDEDDDMEVDGPGPSAHEEKVSNELDKILGVSEDDNEPNRNRSRIKSQLQLPRAFKVPPHSKTIFLRTPNFVKIQSQAFDKNIYQAEEERKEFDGATSVIRYRSVDSSPKFESNARLLQWSDGTQQLVVGDAIFDMKVVPTENW